MNTLPDIDFFHCLADAAQQETLPRYRTKLGVESKDKPGYTFDPVTDADRQAEVVIRALIEQHYPGHAILGEEFGLTGEGPIQWVLDPVDGTRPFLCGLPVWGTLLGLMDDGHARMGMMSQPFTGERFWGDATGAWGERYGQRYPLRTRDVALPDAILHTTSPEHYHGAMLAGFERLQQAVRMTRYGGECYAVAMLAAGHIDLCLEPSLQPYDIVALIPIVERAGGVVTRLDGGRAETGGPVLAAGTPALHAAALAILNGSGNP